MKRFFMPGLLVMAFTWVASAQAPFYRNITPFSSPPSPRPQIDAYEFLNTSTFEVTVPAEQTAGNQFNLFSTHSTLNYTNTGVLTGNPGFDFQYYPSTLPPIIPGVPFYNRNMAGNFVNQGNGFGGGVINCTGRSTNYWLNLVFAGFLPPFSIVGNGELNISATNIQNSGSLNMNASSVMRLSGKNVNLNRGELRQSTPMDIFVVSNGVPLNLFLASPNIDLGSFFYYTGILDGYWGTGFDFLFDPTVMNNFPPASAPSLIFGTTIATTRSMQTIDPKLSLDPVQAYVSTAASFGPGVFDTSVVFIRNTNPAVKASVYFDGNGIGFGFTNFFFNFGRISIQWQWTNTDFQTGLQSTNYVTMVDDYLNLSNLLNLNLVFATNYANTLVHGNIGNKFTYQPYNFSFSMTPYGNASNAPAVPASSPLGIFNNNLFFTTPQYSAYQAIFSASAQTPGVEVHSDVTNMPGRIEIRADGALDLADSRISALSYLLLKATNHFQGSSGALIQSPNLDVLLRSTNGLLAITNLVVPYLPTPDGTVSCYSMTWIDNFFLSNTTNRFHVLFVDANFDPVTRPKIQTLSLTATNIGGGDDAIVISDSLNVTRSMQINTKRLTVTANGEGGFNSMGQINLLNRDINWSTALPRLQYLTNYGVITSPTLMSFAGNMTGPFADPNLATPYQTFINHGFITNAGSFIRANYFVNDGVFQSGTSGNFSLVANCAYLTNGTISALSGGGDVSITADNLVISNHVLQAGGRLTISPTGCFSDGYSSYNLFGHVVDTNTPVLGVVSNGNFMALSGDFGFLTKPVNGNLLGTTISNNAAPFRNVIMTWSGKDRGVSPLGFSNNLAVGRLVLNGNAGSKFSFTGTAAGSALYVDRLELLGSITNFGPAGLTNINIGSNIKVYFAQATANGVSIAEQLHRSSQMNGGNSGRFYWVSNYAGIFSATNIVDPNDFLTRSFNQALVESENIDSDGDTLVNRFDATPIPLSWNFDVVSTNRPCDCDSGTLAIINLGGTLHSGHEGGSDSTVLAFPGESGSGGSSSGVTNLFTLTQGTYHGLFYETNGVATASAGYFKATVTKSGKVTGALKLAGKTYSFSGAFATNGHFVKTNLSADKRSLRLNLDALLDTTGGGQINGSVASSNWTAVLRADRQTAQVKSKFSVVFPGDDVTSTNSPAGHGFAALRLKTDGTVQWSGALGDGTSIPETQSSGISSQGLWPLYLTPYGGAGLLLGWMHFDTNQPDSDLSGNAVWIKPGNLPSKYRKYYPAGFTNQLGVVGSAFVEPAVKSTNGAVVVEGGNLSQPVTNSFGLNSSLKVPKQGANQFSFSLTKSNGVFQGSELMPINVNTKFQGVLLQKLEAGYGFFLGTNRSGQVKFVPLP
ncbi:MAG: hypothetical protein U1F65_01015 [Verrucomicrobiota bacterium]